MIPLSQPDITAAEIEAVVEVLRSSRLSLGPKLEEFESAMSAYTGAAFAVALSSGSAGLCLGLAALGIRADDEVIVPSFAFVAAANCIRYVGSTPIFVDIEPATLNLDPTAVVQAITTRTRAILAVHTFGVPAKLDSLSRLAVEHNLFLIEDACEALGAEYKHKQAGSIGKFGVFSFYPNKPITTGEGGVLITDDPVLASQVKAMRNQGRSEQDQWNQHSLIGYNHRLPEMSCALGVVQLRRIKVILKLREEIANEYSRQLSQYCPEVELPPLSVPNGYISWFAFVVRLPANFCGVVRDAIIEKMAEQGIQCRAYFPPIHRMTIYAAYSNRSLPVTENLSGRTLALPFFNQISSEQIKEVCQCLATAMASLAAA